MAGPRPGAAPAISGTVADIARRHDPDAHTKAFARRDDQDLPFDPGRMPQDAPVMLDTNVYLRRLQGKLPTEILDFILVRRVLHSGVACGELAISAGILDPAHPATARNRAAVMELLKAIPDTDIVTPSADAWAEAGVLSGILARTQHLAKPKRTLTPDQACCQEGLRRKLVNDALIFLNAREQGAVLLSANSKDMDLLLRFRPDATVLLFR